MGIFTNKKDSSYYDSEVDALMETVDIQDVDFEDPYVESMKIVAESEYNHNQLMKAIGMYEVQSYVENSGEVIYESGAISSIWEKIKAFFKALWEKIKAFFNKVISIFDSYTKSAKEFAQKYRTKLGGMLKNTSDFKFKGYNFTHLDESIDFEALGKKINDVTELNNLTKNVSHKPGAITRKLDTFLRNQSDNDLDNIYDNLEDEKEKMRGAAIGGGSYTASEFNEELFMYFRNGEKDKEELDNPGREVNTVLDRMLNSDKDIKTVKDLFKGIEKGMNDKLKGLEKVKNDIIKTIPNGETPEAYRVTTIRSNSEKIANLHKTDEQPNINAVKSQIYFSWKSSIAVKQYNYIYILTKETLNIYQQLNGAKIKALKDRASQDKQYCVAIMSYRPKNS